MDKDMIDCMTEAGLDTVEIRLRRRMEDLLSEGNIEGAERIEEKIKSLDNIDLCAESGRELFDDLKKIGFYDVSENDYRGAIGGRRFKETYGGKPSRY